MHDIGKIGIRIDKLNKPQRLTPEEYELIKSHPVHGKRILEPISFLRHLVPCVYHHHEAWDGSGYPAGLEGEEIPMESRILAVADAYDAMTTDRPYRKALPHSVAMGELDRFAGKQFDVRVVKIFRQVIENNRQERIELGLIVPL
jgi:HD-GYP domain-containing protein (c-di-GMP phosphodiesterase class II)